MKKFEFSLAVGLIISVILSGFSVFAKDMENVRSNVLRLHILANSDSEYDQNLKLLVRDAVLEETGDIFENLKSVDEAKKSAEKNLDRIKRISERVISENGQSYAVSVYICNMYFETRVYENFTLPAGYYDAVRIEIGKAEGKNWWCVMFPPLCFVDGTTNSEEADKKLESMLDQESYDIITAQNEDGSVPFEIKFKIVEFYGRLSGRDKVYAKAGDD